MVTRRAALAMGGAGLLTSSPSAWAQEADPINAAADVQVDLDALWITLQAVSPEPFRTSDRAAVETLYRRTRARIDEVTGAGRPTTGGSCRAVGSLHTRVRTY